MHNQAIDAIPRVRYEWHMFRYLHDRLCEINPLPIGPFNPEVFRPQMHTGIEDEVASVYLECFLLHARVLDDFFYKDTCNELHKDDVLAWQYFESLDEWNRIRPTSGSYLKKNRDRLNKSLAHLTYARIKYERDGKGWDHEQIFDEIENLWNIFLRGVPEHARIQFEPVDDEKSG